VRKQLGIKLQGEGNLLQLRQALYYCEDLYERIPIGKGRHYHVADNQASFLIVQDSTKHFTLHAIVEKDEDMATQFEKVVVMPVKYEMLYVGQWKQNLLLSDRYAENRVFMAGDAVHLVIPTGGLGMNTGVGDAIDLSWKPARILRDRTPQSRRGQCRRFDLCLARPPRVALAMEGGHSRQHARRRRNARQSRPHG
jgi:hypothetical protein